MKKSIKILAGLLIVLIALALIAPYVIPAETIKNAALQKIQAATGRNITVGGAFRMKFFPFIGVYMEQVTVPNPPDFGDSTPLASLKSMNVSIALLPLLSGNVQVKSLSLDDPQINLHVNKAGMKNWEFAPAVAEKSASKESTPEKSAMAGPRNLVLGDVKISDGHVIYDDEPGKSRWEAKDLDLGVSLRGLNDALSIDGSADVNGKKTKFKATLDSLATFLQKQQTRVEASVDSELLSLDTKGIMKGMTYGGKAAVKSPSLKNLMAWANPGAKPPGFSGPLALDLSSEVACSTFECSLTGLKLSLDKLEAKGSIKLRMDSDIPSLDADLSTGMLDLNPFLPQQHAMLTPGIIDAVADSGKWSDAPIDFSALKALNARFNLNTEGILFHHISIGKTQLGAQLSHGRLSASIPDSQMYDGHGSLVLNLDSSVQPAGLEVKYMLKGVQAQKLLGDFAGVNRISGIADIQGTTSGHGNSERQMIESLSGNGNLKLSNGVIKGIDLSNMLRNVTTAFKTGDGRSTPINELDGTYTIAQGIISNRDLVMKTPGLNASGQGEINLPAYNIRYRLTPQMVGSAKNAQGQAVEKQGLGVPVMIEGSLDNPLFRPDVGSIVQDALKNPKQFKEQLKNTENTFKGQVPKGTGKTLKGLLKGL